MCLDGYYQRKERVVEDLKSYYNFYNDEKFQLCSTIFTDLNRWKIIPFKDSIWMESCNIFEQPEDIVKIDPINFKSLLKKKKLIEYNLKRDLNVKNETKINFCNVPNAKCGSCYIKELTYSITQIQSLTKIQLIEELTKHKHPKSRLINSKQRNIKQAKEELKNHYRSVHFAKD